jgi:hypothetical protein
MSQLELVEHTKYGADPYDAKCTMLQMRMNCPNCHGAVCFVLPVDDPKYFQAVYRQQEDEIVRLRKEMLRLNHVIDELMRSTGRVAT